MNFFGKVSADDNAKIGNSLVGFFGLVKLGEGVSVGKDMVTMFGVVRAPESVAVGQNRVAMPPWIFLGPLILVGLFAILIVHEYRAGQRRRILAGYR